MKRIVFFLFFCFSMTTLLQARILKPGFDKEEYIELLKITAQTNGSKTVPSTFYPQNFILEYTSPQLGLDNMWSLWVYNQEVAAIAIRGTVETNESWLANLYAAMVPAKGEMQLTGDYVFKYELASNPQAAVHVGWLLATGFLAQDILPKIDSCYKKGIRDFYITGHSQGGGISFLMTSYLKNLQLRGIIPSDIQFKTYCSAGPKPGNLYYAYEYELQNQDGWAYNVVNVYDCVPMLPFTVQTSGDFVQSSPLHSMSDLIRSQEQLPHRVLLNIIYKKMDEPSQKALETYQKFLGSKMEELVKRHLSNYNLPEYYPSNNYVRAGNQYILQGDENYAKHFSLASENLIEHHSPAAYYYLLNPSPKD